MSVQGLSWSLDITNKWSEAITSANRHAIIFIRRSASRPSVPERRRATVPSFTYFLAASDSRWQPAKIPQIWWSDRDQTCTTGDIIIYRKIALCTELADCIQGQSLVFIVYWHYGSPRCLLFPDSHKALFPDHLAKHKRETHGRRSEIIKGMHQIF